MTTRSCLNCACDFAVRPNHPTQKFCSQDCAREHVRAEALARRAAKPPAPSQAKCRRCGGPLPPGVLTSNVRYCSDACRFNTAESVPGGVPCNHCGRLFEKKYEPRRPQLYCGKVCRAAAFKARHAGYAQLDAEGEIVVNDLETCPRRLAVAKLFDRFEGTGFFSESAPVEWMNPADRRFAR